MKIKVLLLLLAVFTGIIFAGYTFGTGEPVVKGGRYDRLLTYFGRKAPAIGFAIVVDQLLSALSRQKITLPSEEKNQMIVYAESKIAEAVEKLKKEGKIKDFGVSNFTSSQTELIRQKTAVNFNQIQFSATQYQAMTDGSIDYMQQHHITPLSWNPLGTVFREDVEQTRRLKKLLVGLVEKYGVGSDTILLAWILKHPAKIKPVAGTVNIARIQALMKAVDLQMDTQDWFSIWTESMGHKVP